MEAALLGMDLRLPCHGMAHAELRLLATPGRAGPPFRDLTHGTPIAIGLGSARSEPVFEGEITAIEIRMGEGPPELVLLAEDALHRLARRMHPRAFADTRADDLVAALVNDVGLVADVALDGPPETLVKGAESDLAFLLRLVAARGGNLRLEGGRVRAGPETADAAVVTVPAEALAGLRIIADLNWQPGVATVRGWNLDQAAEVGATAAPDLPQSAAQSGPALATQLGWNADPVVPRDNVSAPRAAELARLRTTTEAMRFLHGEIVANVPGPVPGGLIEITGTDSRFAGMYRVGDCRHHFTGAAGLSIMAAISRSDWYP